MNDKSCDIRSVGERRKFVLFHKMRYANTPECIVPLPYMDTLRDRFIKPFGNLGVAKLSYFVQDPDGLTGAHAKEYPELNKFPKLTLKAGVSLEELHEAFISSFRVHIEDILGYMPKENSGREGLNLFEEFYWAKRESESGRGVLDGDTEIVFYHTHNTLDAYIGFPMLISHRRQTFWALHELEYSGFNKFASTRNDANFGAALRNMSELVEMSNNDGNGSFVRIIEYLTEVRLCPLCGVVSDHSRPRDKPFSSRAK